MTTLFLKLGTLDLPPEGLDPVLAVLSTVYLVSIQQLWYVVRTRTGSSDVTPDQKKVLAKRLSLLLGNVMCVIVLNARIKKGNK